MPGSHKNTRIKWTGLGEVFHQMLPSVICSRWWKEKESEAACALNNLWWLLVLFPTYYYLGLSMWLDNSHAHVISSIKLTAEKSTDHKHTNTHYKYSHTVLFGNCLSMMITDWQEASRSEGNQTKRHMFAHSKMKCDHSAPLGLGDIMGLTAGWRCDNLMWSGLINHCFVTSALVSVYVSTNWNPAGTRLTRSHTLAPWRLVQGGESLDAEAPIGYLPLAVLSLSPLRERAADMCKQ